VAPVETQAPTRAVATAAAPPDESFRASAPTPDQVKPFVPPQAAQKALSNGIPVWLVAEPSRYCTIEVVAKGGLVDAVGGRGEPMDLVFETMVGMARGTSKWDYAGLSDQLGLHLMPVPKGTTDKDGLEYEVTFPSDQLAGAVDVLAEIVLRPSFDKKTFERSREQDARGYEDEASDAQKVAQRVALRALLGKHPYASFSTPRGARSVQPSDAKTLHARMFDPSRISLVVTGDLVAKDVLAALEGAFGKAKVARPAPTAPLLPKPVVAAGPSLVVVDKPGSASVTVAGAYLGPAPASTDELAARMAFYTAISSRVGRGERLRDELKLVPWTAPGVGTGRSAEIFTWYARTSTDKVAPLLAEIERITQDLASTGPTEGELDSIRRWTTGVPASLWETPQSLAESVGEQILLGLPPEALADRFAGAATTTADAMRAAAARYLTRANMRVAVVGDLAALREPLTALGWGPIEARDALGAVVVSGPSAGAVR
jgi:zinc protease